MDIFDIHNVKVEKANAMLRYRRFRKIANLFRLIELFLAVFLSAWIFTRLPSLIGMLSIYLRHALTVIVSPLFIFLISNVIVITLVVISGQLNGNGNGNSNAVSNAVTDLYDEIVNDDAIGDVVNVPVTEPEEKIVYQDKQVVSEAKRLSNDRKVYKRSQSENLMKNERCLDEVKLKRSETELGRRKSEIPVTENVVDELSDKEFQKRIEGFIAKQVKFHQEEKLAIVVNNNNNNNNNRIAVV
nr:zinc finger protein [Tanacetum cinerariifolium]